MPPIESTAIGAVPEVKPVEETTASKAVIGIIYPPPEVRNIVDKTASFVARNGPEFESRIRQNEVNNPKFNFLNPSDPYHAYYQHKVKEFKEGRGQEPAAPKFPGQVLPPGLQKPLLEQAKIIDIPIVPTEPPPEFEFVADPPSISAFDLDVVKLTAQFVARNGRQFLTNLMNREQRNYQFDFLRPQHSLFNYFTKLVEQYTKILIPPKDLLTQLKAESDDYHKVLSQVKYRVEWAKHQERERRKEAEAIERERVAYAQVDWHDFVVVETVDFQPSEQGNLPPPTTPAEVGARVLAQERIDRGEVDEGEEMEVESDEEDDETEIEKDVGQLPRPEMELQDMDESSSDEEGPRMQERAPPQPPAPAPPPPPPPSEIPAPPLPPMPDQVVVIKDYDPKSKTLLSDAPSDQFLVSPITGEKIPAHKVQEHMRIGLLDPKWIEERKRTITEKRDQEEVFAPGSAIDSSLKQLAERRTDIFGVGVEETQIGKKIGEEEKKEKKVVWDGHTASMEKVTQKARENITIEEQIAVIHKVKGLLPDEEKEKIGPAVPPKQPPPPKTAPPPPPPKSQPPPPQAPKAVAVQKVPPPRPPPVAQVPQPLMQQPRGGLMVLPPRPPMPLGLHPPMHMPHMMPGPPGPPHPPNYPPSLMGGNRPPGPPHKNHPPPPMEDEPMAKKQKTEDQLIPEEEFLQKNKGPVTFKVVVPKVTEKAEWKLNGQTLSFTLPLTDAISVMKAKLNESLGLPAGKQKLQYEGIFMKDSNSLAYYNFVKGATVQLQLKERGGRKK